MTTSYETFAEALEASGAESPEQLTDLGKSICGVKVSDVENRYFVADSDTDMEAGHAIAFQVKHGRPMSEYETWLLNQAKLRGTS